ncbi:MAG: DUF3579 domain-containing protein [Gammaproteobacteria bacterium]
MTDKNAKDDKKNTAPSPERIIIQGVTENGETFRPSDWAERMSGGLSTFSKDHRLIYSPLLQPTVKDGYKCVKLDPKLKVSNPMLYENIMKFAQKNKLQICKEKKEEDNQ